MHHVTFCSGKIAEFGSGHFPFNQFVDPIRAENDIIHIIQVATSSWKLVNLLIKFSEKNSLVDNSLIPWKEIEISHYIIVNKIRKYLQYFGVESIEYNRLDNILMNSSFEKPDKVFNVTIAL